MSPFTDIVVKTLTTNESDVASDPKNHDPLLSQEEIDDEQPPRINLTAVICTAIVSVCATIIICVARPWRNEGEDLVAQADIPQSEVVVPEGKTNTTPAQAKPAEPKQAKPAEEKVAEQKQAVTEPAKVQPTGLPVVPVTTTGTENPYNNVRLIDASSRKLTQAEVAQMTKTELTLARNAIYARHGYVYKHAELGEFFSKQPWFKPNKTLKLEDVKPLFTETEVANINLILAQEKK